MRFVNNAAVIFGFLLSMNLFAYANNIEPDALFLEADDYSIKFANEFRDIILRNGYKCEKISAYIPMTHRNGAQIQCDEFTSIYIVLRLFGEDPDIQYIPVPVIFE